MATGTVLDRFVTEFAFRSDMGRLNQIEQRVNRIRGRLDAAAGAFARIGAVFAGATGVIVKTGLDTDKAMKTLEARTGAAADQLKRFKEQAYEVGSQLPLNTAEIIAAQTAMIQLGNTMEETYELLPTAAKAAVASGQNIEDVSRWATIAKNTFQATGEEMATFMDIMLKAETISPADMRGMGEGLQYSSQSAKDAGLEFHEYIATLGLLGGAGREVEGASQGLQQLLTNFAKGGQEGLRGGKIIRKSLAVLGIEIEEVQAIMDIEGGGEGFIGVLRMMAQRIGDVSDPKNAAKLTAVMAALSGTSYSPAFSFLLQNLDKLEANIETLSDAQGEADRQAKVRMGGLSGGFETLKAQLDTLLNRMSDAKLGETFEGLFRGVANAIDWVAKLDEETLSAIGTTLLFGTGLIVLGGVLKIASFALGAYVGVYKLFVAAMALGNKLMLGTRIALVAVAVQAAAVAAGMKIAAAAQWVWNAALTANPIGLVIVGIAALVAALVGLYMYFPQVQEAFGRAWDWMAEKAMQVKDWILSSVENLVNGAIDLLNGLGLDIDRVSLEIEGPDDQTVRIQEAREEREDAQAKTEEVRVEHTDAQSELAGKQVELEAAYSKVDDAAISGEAAQNKLLIGYERLEEATADEDRLAALAMIEDAKERIQAAAESEAEALERQRELQGDIVGLMEREAVLSGQVAASESELSEALQTEQEITLAAGKPPDPDQIRLEELRREASEHQAKVERTPHSLLSEARLSELGPEIARLEAEIAAGDVIAEAGMPGEAGLPGDTALPGQPGEPGEVGIPPAYEPPMGQTSTTTKTTHISQTNTINIDGADKSAEEIGEAVTRHIRDEQIHLAEEYDDMIAE